MFKNVRHAIKHACDKFQSHDKDAVKITGALTHALNPVQLCYLQAKYGCYLSREYLQHETMEVLVAAMMRALPTGAHNRRGVSKLIRVYFGQNISMISTRADLRCGNIKYFEYKACIDEALRVIGVAAMERAEVELLNIGMIVKKEQEKNHAAL